MPPPSSSKVKKNNTIEDQLLELLVESPVPNSTSTEEKKDVESPSNFSVKVKYFVKTDEYLIAEFENGVIRNYPLDTDSSTVRY